LQLGDAGEAYFLHPRPGAEPLAPAAAPLRADALGRLPQLHPDGSVTVGGVKVSNIEEWDATYGTQARRERRAGQAAALSAAADSAGDTAAASADAPFDYALELVAAAAALEARAVGTDPEEAAEEAVRAVMQAQAKVRGAHLLPEGLPMKDEAAAVASARRVAASQVHQSSPAVTAPRGEEEEGSRAGSHSRMPTELLRLDASGGLPGMRPGELAELAAGSPGRKHTRISAVDAALATLNAEGDAAPGEGEQMAAEMLRESEAPMPWPITTPSELDAAEEVGKAMITMGTAVVKAAAELDAAALAESPTMGTRVVPPPSPSGGGLGSTKPSSRASSITGEGRRKHSEGGSVLGSVLSYLTGEYHRPYDFSDDSDEEVLRSASAIRGGLVVGADDAAMRSGAQTVGHGEARSRRAAKKKSAAHAARRRSTGGDAHPLPPILQPVARAVGRPSLLPRGAAVVVPLWHASKRLVPSGSAEGALNLHRLDVEAAWTSASAPSTPSGFGGDMSAAPGSPPVLPLPVPGVPMAGSMTGSRPRRWFGGFFSREDAERSSAARGSEAAGAQIMPPATAVAPAGSRRSSQGSQGGLGPSGTLPPVLSLPMIATDAPAAGGTASGGLRGSTLQVNWYPARVVVEPSATSGPASRPSSAESAVGTATSGGLDGNKHSDAFVGVSAVDAAVRPSLRARRSVFADALARALAPHLAHLPTDESWSSKSAFLAMARKGQGAMQCSLLPRALEESSYGRPGGMLGGSAGRRGRCTSFDLSSLSAHQHEVCVTTFAAWHEPSGRAAGTFVGEASLLGAVPPHLLPRPAPAQPRRVSKRERFLGWIPVLGPLVVPKRDPVAPSPGEEGVPSPLAGLAPPFPPPSPARQCKARAGSIDFTSGGGEAWDALDSASVAGGASEGRPRSGSISSDEGLGPEGDSAAYRRYTRSLLPNAAQLSELQLSEGANTLTFEVEGVVVSSSLYLWSSRARVVISDVDGTITKSDVLGHIFFLVGKDWTHDGVAELYTNIRANGYHLVYLTSRAIGQTAATKEYLSNIKQTAGTDVDSCPAKGAGKATAASATGEAPQASATAASAASKAGAAAPPPASAVDASALPLGAAPAPPAPILPLLLPAPTAPSFALPAGPVITSPDRLFTAFTREVILRKPQEFKIAALRDIQRLYPAGVNPFFAGFGNRDTDVTSYRAVGVPEGKIFIIDPSGEVRQEVNNTYRKSYGGINALVQLMFPLEAAGLTVEDAGVGARHGTPVHCDAAYTDVNFWRKPLHVLDELDEEAAKVARGPRASGPKGKGTAVKATAKPATTTAIGASAARV
jgi:hypothetical protein